MSSIEAEARARTIADAVRASDRPLTRAELMRRVGKAGFDEAMSAALREGLVHEHPKSGRRGPRYFHEPWRPEPRILELCGKNPMTQAELQRKLPSVTKQDFGQALRQLTAERKLAAVHRHAGGAIKPGTRFATPAVCARILDESIRRLREYYGELGAASEAAPEPLPKTAPSDEDVVRSVLRSMESREDVAVVIADLGKRSGLPKERFDAAVLEIYRKGEVVLHRHDGPFLISEQQRNELVTDGEGRYYVGISWAGRD